MRALSLWQPWATLCVIGAKRYETRSWRFPPALIGKRLLIHAAKTKKELEWFNDPVFKDALSAANYVHMNELPLGAIIGAVTVERCISTTEAFKSGEISAQEERFGNYAPDRYAFKLVNAVRIDPIPCIGFQGVFTVRDDKVLAALFAAKATP